MFFDMTRERHNFFLCWLFHLTPLRAAHFVDPNWSRWGETKNRLSSSKLKSQLTRSRGHPVDPNWSRLGEPQNKFVPSKSETQLTALFQIPQILSASGHDVIHVPGPIAYLGILFWHLWLSHPPRTRVNTCAQCVHLSNPCTKRKVLSLTKPKGKIYKTKNYNIKKIPPQLYYTAYSYQIISIWLQIIPNNIRFGPMTFN